MADFLDLYDYRLQVAGMYRERNAALAAGEDQATVLNSFRRRRDDLFASHPQSALDGEHKASFHGLSYFPYNPDARVEGILLREDAGALDLPTSGPEDMPMRRAGVLRFSLAGQAVSLPVYWIDVYGGGLFLPFRDGTAPQETYGGGRYLFDTVKGSDFHVVRQHGEGWDVIVDFNYAYNPSCAYHHRWVCPLAPRENHLSIPIRAGERTFAP